MRKHKMTEWDIGQVLIKAFDCLSQCSGDLEGISPLHASLLKELAYKVGAAFNCHNSHDFDLPDGSLNKRISK